MKRLIPFEKYEATGNDFVIFDFFEFEWFDLNNAEFIRIVCDRHFGIGADGLIALQKVDDFDFKMNYFNSDGRRSSFCGNGSRASLKYMQSKFFKNEFNFVAQDGIHSGVVDQDQVSVKMKNIESIITTQHGELIDSGSPHLIIETENPMTYPVNEEGRRLRNLFNPEGVNVNFIAFNENGLSIATYERGVEWETLACGTGVTASAYYKCVKQGLSGKQTIPVSAKGGSLIVTMEINGKNAENIWLKGKANNVFSGFYPSEK